MYNILKGDKPFLVLHADHCGPLEKTSKGFRHLLVITDGFTFVKLYSCKSTNSEETIKHMKDYFRNYSRPRHIITDRGTVFTSIVFTDFLKSEMIDHVLIAVGTPCANGQVERCNRVIIPMIAKLCESPNKWDCVLDKVEFAINNTVCRSTGNSPNQLLFGIVKKAK